MKGSESFPDRRHKQCLLAAPTLRLLQADLAQRRCFWLMWRVYAQRKTQQTPNRFLLFLRVVCAAEMAAYVECEFVCVRKKERYGALKLKEKKSKKAAATNTPNQLGVLQGDISSPTLTIYRSSQLNLALFVLLNT